MIDAIRNVFRYSKLALLLSAATSLLSGACNVYLLTMVGTAINRMPHLPPGYGFRFGAFLLLTFASSIAAQLLSVHLTASLAARIRMQLSRAIMDSPLRNLEEIGTHKIIAVLTQDAGSIAQAALQVSQFGMNGTIVLCCLGYLAYVSLSVFVAIVLMLPVSVLLYLFVEYFAVRFQSLERENWDNLVKQFQTLTHGVKELKLNRRRAAFFVRQLLQTSELARRYGVMGAAIYIAIISWSNLLCFAAIGVIVFILPHMAVLSHQALVGSALVALFLRIPVAGLIDALREFNRASVTLKKLRKLQLPWQDSEIAIKDQEKPPAEWRSIDLVDVTHAYLSEDDAARFVLGPICMSLTPGRIVFITGGNGSGKTTLAKLIVGLYKPESGVTKVDGIPVDENMRDDYRQRFSAIFSEYALFQEIIEEEATPVANHYLRLLRLDQKVQLRNGSFSTVDLSAGQRRRLALVHAYLENRPIYLFDEWAADQDPAFKEIFYCKLLPELRARNKAVIVISHDDRYYHVADEVIRLENGKVVAAGEMPRTHAEPALSLPGQTAIS